MEWLLGKPESSDIDSLDGVTLGPAAGLAHCAGVDATGGCAKDDLAVRCTVIETPLRGLLEPVDEGGELEHARALLGGAHGAHDGERDSRASGVVSPAASIRMRFYRGARSAPRISARVTLRCSPEAMSLSA